MEILIYIVCITIMVITSVIKSYEMWNKNYEIINEIDRWTNNELHRKILKIWMEIPILNLIPTWYLGARIILE